METFKIPGLETKTESEEELGLRFEEYEYNPDKVFVPKKETTISEEKLKVRSQAIKQTSLLVSVILINKESLQIETSQ